MSLDPTSYEAWQTMCSYCISAQEHTHPHTHTFFMIPKHLRNQSSHTRTRMDTHNHSDEPDAEQQCGSAVERAVSSDPTSYEAWQTMGSYCISAQKCIHTHTTTHARAQFL